MQPTLPGRREANKARTRQAILDATRALVLAEQTTSLTADRIADAAGVSRRTLFNYFPSTDDLLAEISLEAVERFSAAVLATVEQQPLVDSAESALDDILTTDLLADLVPVWRVVDESRAVAGLVLHAERQLIDRLVDDVVDRMPACAPAPAAAATAEGPDGRMFVAVTATCVFAAFETARRHWLATVEPPVTDADRDRLVDLATRALRLAREGLAHA